LGQILIDRVVGVELSMEQWLQSSKPLLEMEVADRDIGFETRPDLAHADFANMFIGGGALSGGCVQEEIRFSICPELCLSMLICPCMLEHEAIQIVGAEQFSSYKGYAFSLRFGGDYVDKVRRKQDGSLLTSVLAMDANDLRCGDSSVAGQHDKDPLHRDLNKSLAAFTPIDEDALKEFEVVATGNWGCGAFLGCAQIKALTQLASASQSGRRLCYFPFDQNFGPELKRFIARCREKRVTVGALLDALLSLQPAQGEHPEEARAAGYQEKPLSTKRKKELDGDDILKLVAAKLSL